MDQQLKLNCMAFPEDHEKIFNVFKKYVTVAL